MTNKNIIKKRDGVVNNKMPSGAYPKRRHLTITPRAQGSRRGYSNIISWSQSSGLCEISIICSMGLGVSFLSV